MKIYVDLTPAEKYSLSKLTPTHSETYMTVYSEEGVYDVRNKIHKQCFEDKAVIETKLNGRVFLTDESVVVPKEMWQIPCPNKTVTKTVHTYNLSNEMCCVVEFDPNATYYFTGVTVEKVSEWLISGC